MALSGRPDDRTYVRADCDLWPISACSEATSARLTSKQLVAEQQFRRIIGYRHLAELVIAIERRAALIGHPPDTTVTHTQVAEAVTV
jgi:hypothetical protein